LINQENQGSDKILMELPIFWRFIII